MSLRSYSGNSSAAIWECLDTRIERSRHARRLGTCVIGLEIKYSIRFVSSQRRVKDVSNQMDIANKFVTKGYY